MFEILDGRKFFYQWDSEQKLIVKDATIQEVHLANVSDSIAYISKTYQEGQHILCDIPDFLLMDSSNIVAYAFLTDKKGNRTIASKVFGVKARQQPDDYVPPIIIPKWSQLEKRIETLENNIGTATLVYSKTFETWEQLFELNEIGGKPYKFTNVDVYIKQATSTRTSVVQVGISESENIRVLGIYGTAPQLVHFSFEVKNKCLEMAKYQRNIDGSVGFTSESKAILKTDIESIESIYIFNESTDETVGFTVGTTIEVYAS